MRILLTIVLIFAALAARAEELAVSLGGIPGRVWLPEGEGSAPLLIFSHGFGGCPAQARFLTEGLAEAGYIVVAPEHADHACGWPPKPEVPFRMPENWTPDVFIERRDDIFTTVAALKSGEGWTARIDWAHVGILGHSLGGYTALALAGAVPGWKMDGIGAIAVMSPYCTPFIYRGGLDRVSVPVLYQGGTRDKPITPTVIRPGGCFDLNPSPAWYAGIRGAWHLSWTGLATSARVRGAILGNVVQFFDMELKGRGGMTALPGLAELVRK